MQKTALRLMSMVLMLAGLALLDGPATAQQAAPKWKAPMATITVTTAPFKNLRDVERLTIFGQSYLAVSASVPVPYGDLNLAQDSGANELGRRVHLAAQMACQQLEIRYPPNIYPVIGTDDCAQAAANDGMTKANDVIAAAKR